VNWYGQVGNMAAWPVVSVPTPGEPARSTVVWDRHDIRHVDPDQDGVPPGPAVGLAGMDEAAGREEETAELSMVRRIMSGFVDSPNGSDV
jgi:hypothetical protein